MKELLKREDVEFRVEQTLLKALKRISLSWSEKIEFEEKTKLEEFSRLCCQEDVSVADTIHIHKYFLADIWSILTRNYSISCNNWTEEAVIVKVRQRCTEVLITSSTVLNAVSDDQCC